MNRFIRLSLKWIDHFCSIRNYVIFVYLIYMNYRYIYHCYRLARQHRAGESVCSVKEILIFWNLHVYVNRQVVRCLGYVACMEYGGYFGFDDFAFHTIFQL